MKELSVWRTLAPPQDVLAEELRVALSGSAPPVPRDKVLGQGVNHAFGSKTGRFRLVERAWTIANPFEGDPVEDEGDAFGWQRTQLDRPEAWEWFSLAGPSENFPIAGFDDSHFEIRPSHRLGDAFIEDERRLVGQLRTNSLWHRLRDRIVTDDIVNNLDAINAEFARQHCPQSILRTKRELQNFHRTLPSRDVLADLRYMRLQDPNLPLEQHDRVDLMGLAVALVYCDVVLTERRWAHLAQRADVAGRFGTSVGRSLRDLELILRTGT